MYRKVAWKLDFELEKGSGGIGGKDDLCGDLTFEGGAASAKATPLKPKAQVSLAAVVPKRVGELRAVAAGDDGSLSALCRYLQAPQEAFRVRLGGVH